MEALSDIPGWERLSPVPLDTEIVEALALDDYIYQQYRQKNEIITLYIGYYLEGASIGAAHDPLVCFPGQGWVISNRQRGSLQIKDLDAHIAYSAMTVRRGEEEQRLIYWFQAMDTASADTIRQKIAALFARLRGKGEESAFVRLSCISSKESNGCEQAMINFSTSMYPRFLHYVFNSPQP